MFDNWNELVVMSYIKTGTEKVKSTEKVKKAGKKLISEKG